MEVSRLGTSGSYSSIHPISPHTSLTLPIKVIKPTFPSFNEVIIIPKFMVTIDCIDYLFHHNTLTPPHPDHKSLLRYFLPFKNKKPRHIIRGRVGSLFSLPYMGRTIFNFTQSITMRLLTTLIPNKSQDIFSNIFSCSFLIIMV